MKWPLPWAMIQHKCPDRTVGEAAFLLLLFYFIFCAANSVMITVWKPSVRRLNTCYHPANHVLQRFWSLFSFLIFLNIFWIIKHTCRSKFNSCEIMQMLFWRLLQVFFNRNVMNIQVQIKLILDFNISTRRHSHRTSWTGRCKQLPNNFMDKKVQAAAKQSVLHSQYNFMYRKVQATAKQSVLLTSMHDKFDSIDWWIEQ